MSRRFLGIVAVVTVLAVLLIWRINQPPPFPHGIVIHHSASPMANGTHLIGAEDIARWHEGQGFGVVYEGKLYHIGYHYVIRADGKVESGRPEGCRGSHATQGNDCLGICVVGDFSSNDNPRQQKGPWQPTPAQMKSLTGLCRKLMKQHRWSTEQVRTHSQVDGDTECPGNRFPFDGLIRDLQREQ